MTSIVEAEPMAVSIERDVITATGPDAERFLQGQLSQDVVALVPGGSAWSLLLAPQGKVVAWLRVTRVDDETFLLDVDHGSGDSALARLRRFLLRTKCDLTLETWHTVAVRGQRADPIDQPGGPDAPWLLPVSWPGFVGFDLLGRDVELPLDIRVGTPEELEILRIRAGVPVMGHELDEGTIPAEAGIVGCSANFTKGCYTGQELVARIDSRGGNVPRRLRGLRSAVALQVGETLLVDGAAAGTITSAVLDPREGWVGLAYVKRGVEMPATMVVAAGSVSVHELAPLD